MQRPIPTVRILFALFIASLVLNLWQLTYMAETAYKLNQAMIALKSLKNYDDMVINGYREECTNRDDAPKEDQ